MNKLVVWTLIGMVFSLFEISFIRSLPGVFVYTPFVFALCVYVVQHQGVPAFIWWLPIHGLILDLNVVGYPSIHVFSYLLGAAIVSLSAKHVFSNRSYYGVLTCAMIGFLGILLSEAFFSFLRHFSVTQLAWNFFLEESMYRLVLLLFVVTLFYPFAKRIRSVLLSSALLPEIRKTY